MQNRTVIVDYGMGNLRSVQKALERVGCPAAVVDCPDALDTASKIVLPGVGAFGDAMDGLRQRGLVEPLVRNIRAGKPFLGICLGLQLLFTKSYEDGEHEGLDLIPGEVVRFDSAAHPDLKIPHMGWNRIRKARKVRALAGVGDDTYMYFVHSYYVRPNDAAVAATRTDYGVPFVSAIEFENLFATQFHPEKSQANGLRILGNFAQLSA
ncbi:MAG: imidazole glycerol phosphate synthase subunit HisH [Planctomycetes bacterium]|nr:imidazole glycerol phosphate synthase subunit HisH [Planctomycetota bacterium]